ncbi:spondin-1-like isoform X2 [Planococcus citri]|uniref:spondin-1-like isoform X2 n=1 Tax=Planococcus citri TaxID=170843 RepID=UPI0031F741C7
MRFLMLILLLYHIRNIHTWTCDVRPKGASGSPNEDDGKFIIEIATTPEKYIPQQLYNVTLKGKNSVIEGPIQFNGFSITVQPRNMNDVSPILDPNIAGVLEVFPGDMTAKVDEKCPNMVIHTSHIFVSEVIVQWAAPPAGRGCMTLRASVMEQNVWYRNNFGLMTEICEDDNVKSDDNIEDCEACNEAKYELKFEGMWTRQSHPLYFPGNVWTTRFSDVIGSSHGTSYRFWKESEMASQGLIDFLDNENTTTLETEIKSNETRTVIKAKGLRYPNITGKTFAVFRVDKNHHLLSIISLIIPSPDWFVGVSGLELCNKTEWIPDKIIDLYPYDLGLYDGLQYTSPKEHTNETITKIDHATVYASPFHTNNTEKLKPLARVHLTRSRVYERACSEDANSYTTSATPIDNRNNNDCPDGNCNNLCNMVTDRVPWSGCSFPECDDDRVKGKFPSWSDDVIKQCFENNQTTETLSKDGCASICYGEDKKLAVKRRQLVNQNDCPTTPWTPFSACDGTCRRTRTRALTDEGRKNLNCVKLIFEQKIKCDPGCLTDKEKKITSTG